MNLQDIHRNARILRRRYERQQINVADYMAELWQLASEIPVYTISTDDWLKIRQSWTSVADEFNYYRNLVKELTELPEE